MSKKYLAAVDLGGTNVRVSIADKSGILYKVSQSPKLEGSNTSIPQQVDFLIGYVCDQLTIAKSEISTVGISTCSPFDRQGRVVAPNLCGGLSGNAPNNWKYIPLIQELSGKYKIVKQGNDCVTAVAAERLFGAGQGIDDLVYVTWSTGIGAGAYCTFIDVETGEKRVGLLFGKNGNAPHAGHMYIAEDGPMCGCGQRGDLESMTSGKSIAKAYNVGLKNKKSAKEIFELYKQGNQRAKRVIQNAARSFARGLVSINALLDTKRFVIGGSVYNDADIVDPIMKKEIYHAFKALFDGVEIKKSQLDKYLGDIAALSLVMPKDWINLWQKTKPWKHAPEAVKLPL